MVSCRSEELVDALALHVACYEIDGRKRIRFGLCFNASVRRAALLGEGIVGSDGTYAAHIFTSGALNPGTETGADYALVWTPLNGPQFTFQGFPFAAGMPVCMTTAHALRAGGNTLSVLSVPRDIKKGTDYTSDLGTAIAAGNNACFTYNAAHDVFQYQGQ